MTTTSATAEPQQPAERKDSPASRRAAGGSSGAVLNRRLKRWPGWLLLGLVAVSLLAVGATRTTGPQTQQERVEAITRRIACPICDLANGTPSTVVMRKAAS